MTDFSSMGKIFMIGGVVFFFVGLLILFGSKIPFLGRLPGDLYMHRKNMSFYFPIVTCVLLSLILSILLNLFIRK